MSLINIANLTYAYEGSYDNIFENVSFQIDTDWKLGFIGRNGRGKTTFLQLLMGRYPYTGTITASVHFDYFPFAAADETQNTLDVIYRIVDDFELWTLNYELSLLDVSEETLYRPFYTLSHGERTKILLAALFLKDNNFLLMDEPTDHLDADARKMVADYLKSKKGFILVSHDRMFLDACVDHVLSINRANIEVQSGNFSTWHHNKQLQDNYELDKNRRLKKEIKRLETTAREKADWSDQVEATKIGTHQADRGRVGHLAAKMMKKSKAIEVRRNRDIEEKSKLLKNIEAAGKLAVKPAVYHTERLVELRDVFLDYGLKQVCGPLTLSINQGDRVALKGKNGSGKSSIIKLCLSLQKGYDGPPGPAYTGELHVGSRLTISYVPQDTSFLAGDLKTFSRINGLDETLFKAILRKLDFARVQFDKNMRDFSDGQKKKVLIAKSLCENAHLYIWDEPLNFVDVISRIQIEELILEYAPTLLFVEHDSVFMEKIATKRVEL